MDVRDSRVFLFNSSIADYQGNMTWNINTPRTIYGKIPLRVKPLNLYSNLSESITPYVSLSVATIGTSNNKLKLINPNNNQSVIITIPSGPFPYPAGVANAGGSAALAATIQTSLNANAGGIGLTSNFTVTSTLLTISYIYTIQNLVSEFALDFNIDFTIGPLIGYGYNTLMYGPNNRFTYPSLSGCVDVGGIYYMPFISDGNVYIFSNMISGVDDATCPFDGTGSIHNLFAVIRSHVFTDFAYYSVNAQFSQVTPYIITDGSEVVSKFNNQDAIIPIKFWIRLPSGIHINDNTSFQWILRFATELQQNIDAVATMA